MLGVGSVPEALRGSIAQYIDLSAAQMRLSVGGFPELDISRINEFTLGFQPGSRVIGVYGFDRSGKRVGF